MASKEHLRRYLWVLALVAVGATVLFVKPRCARAEAEWTTSRTSLQLLLGTTATVGGLGFAYVLTMNEDPNSFLTGVAVGALTPLITGVVVCEVGNSRSFYNAPCAAPIAASYGALLVGLAGLVVADNQGVFEIERHKLLSIVALATLPAFAATIAWNFAHDRSQPAVNSVMVSTPLVSF